MATKVRLCLYDVHRSLLCMTYDKHVVCREHVGADLTNGVEKLLDFAHRSSHLAQGSLKLLPCQYSLSATSRSNAWPFL